MGRLGDHSPEQAQPWGGMATTARDRPHAHSRQEDVRLQTEGGNREVGHNLLSVTGELVVGF